MFAARDSRSGFRYQMEERDGGFARFLFNDAVPWQERARRDRRRRDVRRLRQALHRGAGVSSPARERAAQILTCSEAACKLQVLAERTGGAKLASFLAPPPPPPVMAANVASVTPPPRRSRPRRRPASCPAAVANVANVAPPTPSAAPAPASRPRCRRSRRPRLTRPPAPARIRPRDLRPAPAPAMLLQPQGRHRKDHHVGQHCGGPRRRRGLRVLLVRHRLARQRRRVARRREGARRSLYHVLVMGLKPQDAAINVRPNLDLIAANETLAPPSSISPGARTAIASFANRHSRPAMRTTSSSSTARLRSRS